MTDEWFVFARVVPTCHQRRYHGMHFALWWLSASMEERLTTNLTSVCWQPASTNCSARRVLMQSSLWWQTWMDNQAGTSPCPTGSGRNTIQSKVLMLIILITIPYSLTICPPLRLCQRTLIQALSVLPSRYFVSTIKVHKLSWLIHASKRCSPL